eukprot:3488737-Alexandrium_andersonii.AAC.1
MPTSWTAWRTVTAPHRAIRASHVSVINWKRLKPPHSSLTQSSPSWFTVCHQFQATASAHPGLDVSERSSSTASRGASRSNGHSSSKEVRQTCSGKGCPPGNLIPELRRIRARRSAA